MAMTFLRCVIVVGVVLVTPMPAAADLIPGSPVLIVNLSDPDKGFSVVSARTFDDALRSNTLADWGADPAVQRALQLGQNPNPALGIRPGTPLERAIGACRSQPGRRGLPEAVKPFIARLYNCVDCLKAYSEKRFFTQAGDQVVLLVLYDASQISAEQIRPAFREAPRESELVATGRALAGLFRQESQATPDPACESFVYTLQRSRSTFTVSLAIPPKRGEPGEAGAGLIDPPAAAASGKVVTSPELILGKPERWLFSADFSLSSTSVHLGKAPTADQQKLKNKDFFVALNFAFSDLLPDRNSRLQRRSIWRELLLKVQATPSRRPWEAWAVGVGLRGYKISTILWNMDVVHPYFTVGRQSADDKPHWRTVVGLGFDPRSLGGKK
jgi:hypothetical protein